MLATRTLTAILSVSLSLLTGCALESTATSSDGAALTQLHIQGSVHGGQQPVTGSTIQLYTVGTSTDGTAARSLLTQTTTTDTNGNFNISMLYSCGSATQVYITSTSGNPGTTGNNANLALMTALGACTSLTSSTNIVINEQTTVAAVAALAPYMNSATTIAAAPAEAANLAAAFTTATELVNTATGLTPGLNVPANATEPAQLIATLANILAGCVNTTGGTAGDSSACGTLFTLTTPNSATAPTNTIAAMLNILNNPTANIASLFALAASTAPFQPQLATAPASLQVSLITQPSSVTRTFYAFPESDNSVTPLYTFINGAQSTIDMTMYELVDTTFSADLVAACKRGVRVRVILDQNDEKSSNTAAYNQLNAQTNCSAAWANPAFQVTHQKTITIDGTTTAILSLNLTSRYYSTTRDFALIENDPVDVAAIEATFNTDYAATTDYNYQPSAANVLIWSPTTATSDLLGLINNAKSTLLVENEEMSASNIVSALEAACKRGVSVHIAMTNTGSYGSNFTALEAAGCGVHTYVDNSTTLYIHAKAILADYGTANVAAYMGSINFSTASMTENRELGLYITDSASLLALYNTITSDYAGAPPY
jgi:hypothetical protein